jgi:hypothetical protein
MFVLAICAAVLAGAAALTPGEEAVSWLGWDVPVVCGFRRLTGHPCPGCGLTRSLVFLAHGEVASSFQAHPLGPLVFAFVAAQLPLQGRRLLALRRLASTPTDPRR